ncbi:MAG: TRAP transporter substrate-binding protein DctP [bacterium]|nr:TRAP transporter substrate-binding protein DctP [bacterium]
MKQKYSIILLSFLFFTGPVSLSALTIKLGSLAPIGSPWDYNLKKIGAEWGKVSQGQVVLKIYPGGIVGDEDDMIRKIRIGQLDAAGITGVGLSRIFNGVLAIQLPLLVRDEQELEYVLDKIRPYFEKNIEEKGFKVLLWHTAGWAYFFSKKPVVYPEDLKKLKFWVWEGDPDQLEAWKEQNFQPVPLPATEIMTALQSGMAESFTTSPLTAAAYQWFGVAPHMCEMKWAPFIGTVIIATKVWNKIPADQQVKFMEIVLRIGKAMKGEISKADEKAVEIMKQNGLVTHPVNEDIVKQWKSAVDQGFRKLVGKSIEKESYERVKTYIDEYRKAHGK